MRAPRRSERIQFGTRDQAMDMTRRKLSECKWQFFSLVISDRKMKVSMLVQSLHPTIAVVKLNHKLFALICYAEILEQALYQLVTICVLRRLWRLVCCRLYLPSEDQFVPIGNVVSSSVALNSQGLRRSSTSLATWLSSVCCTISVVANADSGQFCRRIRNQESEKVLF